LSGDNIGKGLIAVVLLVVAVAVVAFIAYPMFFGDNKAKGLQPDLSALPDGWKVDKEGSLDGSSGTLSKDYVSKVTYTSGDETKRIVVVIYVYTTVEKATAKMAEEHGWWSGTAVGGWSPTCYTYPSGLSSTGNGYYFQSGKVVVSMNQTLNTDLTQSQIKSIFDSINTKIAAMK